MVVWLWCCYICNKFNAQSNLPTMPVILNTPRTAESFVEEILALREERDALNTRVESLEGAIKIKEVGFGNYRDAWKAWKKKAIDAEKQAASNIAEVLDLRGLVSLLAPALGNLCNESAFAHKSDDELYLLIPSPAGDMAKHLLEAREAYAAFLAHNTPETEQTSDDYEPVENWRPEREI